MLNQVHLFNGIDWGRVGYIHWICRVCRVQRGDMITAVMKGRREKSQGTASDTVLDYEGK